MPIRINDHKIHLSTWRAKIAPREEPYWKFVDDGQVLGFRKRSNSDQGTWVARWTTNEMQKGKGKNPRRKTVQSVLGRCSADLDYAEAGVLAQAYFKQCKGGVLKAGTVEQACAKYVEDRRAEKGEKAAKSAELRFKRYVTDTHFGRIKLGKLTQFDIERWRDSLVTKSCKRNSANRVLRSFKASMNFAFKHRMVTSNLEWSLVQELSGEGSADRKRTAHLTVEQRKALIAECDTDLANLIRALLHSAARVGELQKANKSDFDARQGTLRLVSLKGKGKEMERQVPLSKIAVAFFREMTKDKLPGAPLLTYQGAPWARHLWAAGINSAVDEANKKLHGDARLPDDTVAYTMRHCAITDMLTAGINVSAVAKITGTSIDMIEMYYFKFIATDVQDKLGQITAF